MRDRARRDQHSGSMPRRDERLRSQRRSHQHRRGRCRRQSGATPPRRQLQATPTEPAGSLTQALSHGPHPPLTNDSTGRTTKPRDAEDDSGAKVPDVFAPPGAPVTDQLTVQVSVAVTVIAPL